MLSDEAVDILGNGSQTFHGCGMRADQPCEIFRLDFFPFIQLMRYFYILLRNLWLFLKKSDYGQK